MSQHLHVKYLLIGAGLASSSAAHAIRQHDAEGAILLVGQEPTRPYHRPPLSKEFLRGQKPREELFTDPVGWFTANNVELHTAERAAHLDAARKTVAMAGGDEVAFDQLLIATGGSPRHLTVPGAQLPNVHYLRNLADWERLHNAIEKAKNEGRPHAKGRGMVTVIGGGLLGVELACSFTQLGLAVDLVIAAPHPWKKFAGETTGKFIARYLEKHGVNVHLNTEPSRLDGDGRVQRVVLTNGTTLPCDFVIPAIGLVASKDLLRGTPIAAEKAILVDDHCRTNMPGIYAAGDCAALLDPLFGKHRLLDHWNNATVTGAVAGRNMAGVDTAYDAVNYFFSEVFGLSLRVWGEAKVVDHRLHRGVPNGDTADLIEIGVAADGRVAQVLSLGHSGDDQVLRHLVKRRFAVGGKEELLKDPKSDLNDLL